MTDTTEKNALRRKMRAARKACTDRATRDDCLLQRLMALSVYQKASCVLSYVSFGTEADTLRILERLVVQVPTSLSAEAKEALRAFDAVSGDSLHAGAGEGIKQEKHHKKRGFFKKED